MILLSLKKHLLFRSAISALLIVTLFATNSIAIAGQNSETASTKTQLLSESIGHGGYLAASLKHGMNPGAEKEALRSFGSYISILMIGIIGFLLVFRGREIRRQHPKSIR